MGTSDNSDEASQTAGYSEELRRNNASLRRQLGMAENDQAPTEDDWLERENEMLEFQIEQLAHNRKLLEQDDKSEALYLLQYLASVPLPTWAAREDGNIVHWGGKCEATYGHSRKKVLGRDFINLFVTEAEKDQARKDLSSIINGQEGLEHFNLCKDKDKSNKQVYLLTCCFPVYDPRSKAVVQAEVSFDLNQLEALRDELDAMHRKHQEEQRRADELRAVKERAYVEELTRTSFAELRKCHDRYRETLENRMLRNREIIADDRSTRSAKALHSDEMAANQKRIVQLDDWERATRKRLENARSKEELERVREAIREKAHETV